MKSQQGFTLIELVVVIVLLGILAAAAIPRFVDLSDEAENAALIATANALQSASVLNFAQRKTNGGGTTITGTSNGTVCDATKLGPIMMGGWPTAYTIEGGLPTMVTDDGVANCKITHVASGKSKDGIPVVLAPAAP